MLACHNVINFAADMKSKSQILILLLASMMVAYLGAGQLVMHCSMTGRVEAIGSHNTDCGGCNDCCSKKQTKSCMTLKVKKLQSSTAQQQIKAEAAQALTLLSAIVEAVVPTDCALPHNAIGHEVEKSPPRHYLTFIRVLLI